VTTLALSIPAARKRPGDVAKGLLLEAFRDTLPQWLLERKKQPFSLPIHRWLTGPLRDYARDTLGPHCRTAALVPAAPYLAALDTPQGESRAARVWSLLALEAWLKVMA
jgi:asparagine synthase (glutamine-hydrolysing)